jgi:alginate O-acetyltransferase complex protein AlgI
MSATVAPTPPTAEVPVEHRRDLAGLGVRLRGFALVCLELGLVLLVVHHYDIAAKHHFFPVLCILLAGFTIHAWLPSRFRAGFFVLLSLGGLLFVLGGTEGARLLAIGGVLIAVCYLPVPFVFRLTIIGGAALMLAMQRLEFQSAFWPVLGSMFMFRLILYLFELYHTRERPPLDMTLAYFFPLQNVCFLFFPLVDFKVFRQTYRATTSWQDAQTGVGWIVRGLSHLLAYRVIKYYLLPAPHELTDLTHLTLFLATHYALYLQISGYFHIITGIFHLFGFELPRTHDHYFLASSFTDIWRRINIYWKDFMTRVFFLPVFFAVRRWGTTLAIVVAALWVFLATWLLHAYAWFWITGELPLRRRDAVLWLVAGVLVAWNLWRDLRRAASTPVRRSRETTLWAATGLSLRVLGVFLLVSFFWACWNAPGFLPLVKAQATELPTFSSVGPLAVLLLVLVGTGVVVQMARARLARLGMIPLRPSPAASALLRMGALGTLLLLAIPQVEGLFGQRGASILASLRQDLATPVESAQVVQGYYEELGSVPVRAGTWLATLEGRARPPEQLHYTDMSQPSDDLLERELIPGWSGEVAGAFLSINRHGMRDRPDRQRPKPAGTCRIALVGSSVVMGFGVGDRETFCYLLEEHLNARRTAREPRYEVLNFGTGKSFVIQRHVLIDRKVYGFEPDIICCVAHQDEFLGPVRHLTRLVVRGTPLPYPCLDEVVRKAGITPDMPWGVIEVRLQPRARAIVLGVYQHLVAECRQRGVLPVWVYLPMPGVVNAPEQSAELLSLAGEAGFVVVNLADWAEGRRPLEVKKSEGDHHPNQLGHRLIAERLEEAFRRPGVLRGRPGNRP